MFRHVLGLKGLMIQVLLTVCVMCMIVRLVCLQALFNHNKLNTLHGRDFDVAAASIMGQSPDTQKSRLPSTCLPDTSSICKVAVLRTMIGSDW
jgi:hypothetical protein